MDSDSRVFTRVENVVYLLHSVERGYPDAFEGKSMIFRTICDPVFYPPQQGAVCSLLANVNVTRCRLILVNTWTRVS